MRTILIVIGILLLLSGGDLLKRGRGGKMTQQGCGTVLIGIILLIVGMVISPGVGESEITPTTPNDRVTPSVYPTVDTTRCTLGAVFQADVSVPDGTRIEAGQRFTKIWRIRNTGTCDWGEGYQLVFIGGDKMGDVKSVPVPETRVGEDTEVSVVLVAPAEEGTYRSNWRMCVNEDQCFGDVLYVKIASISGQ